MKKFITFLLCMSVISGAYADDLADKMFNKKVRIEFTMFTIGANVVTNLKDYMPRVVFGTGCGVGFKVAPNLGISTSLNFAVHVINEGEGATGSCELPVIARLYITPRWSIDAGLSAALIFQNADSEYSYPNLNKVQLAMPLGITYYFQEYGLSLYYTRGISSYLKNTERTRLNTFAISWSMLF